MLLPLLLGQRMQFGRLKPARVQHATRRHGGRGVRTESALAPSSCGAALGIGWMDAAKPRKAEERHDRETAHFGRSDCCRRSRRRAEGCSTRIPREADQADRAATNLV